MSTLCNPDTGLQIGHQMGITNNFSMKVEDVFQVPGFGLIAVGRVLTGSLDLSNDDTVILCNHNRHIQSHVKKIEMFRKLFPYCEWGDNVGLILRTDDEYYVHPGTLICSIPQRHQLEQWNEEDKTQYENEKSEKQVSVASVIDSLICYSSSRSSDGMSSNEGTYLEEYRQCLSDGEISPAEIRLLKKLAISLGISEARVRELEASCKEVKLTEAEKQYLEEYKACLEDGPEISASTRRLLNRLASSLNLTDNQVSRLEKM